MAPENFISIFSTPRSLNGRPLRHGQFTKLTVSYPYMVWLLTYPKSYLTCTKTKRHCANRCDALKQKILLPRMVSEWRPHNLPDLPTPLFQDITPILGISTENVWFCSGPVGLRISIACKYWQSDIQFGLSRTDLASFWHAQLMTEETFEIHWHCLPGITALKRGKLDWSNSIRIVSPTANFYPL